MDASYLLGMTSKKDCRPEWDLTIYVGDAHDREV